MLPPKIKPQKPSADQRRYDNLASRTNVSPSQQRLMDRLGKKLGIGAPNIRLPSIPGNFDPDREGLYPGPRVRGGPADPPVSRPPMPGPGVGFDADRAYPGPRVRGGPTAPPVSRPPTSGPMNPGPMPPPPGGGMKRGGKVKSMSSSGMTSKASTASKRGDGIAQRGKTKGRMC